MVKEYKPGTREHRRLIEDHVNWLERGNEPMPSLEAFYAANKNAPIMKFIAGLTLRRQGYSKGLAMDRAKKRKKHD